MPKKKPSAQASANSAAIVPIINAKTQKLSKEQETFNRYVKRVEKKKVEIEKIKKQLELARVRLNSDIIPAEKTMFKAVFDFVLVLDNFSVQFELKKTDKSILSAQIQHFCQMLLQNIDEERQKVEEIFNRHSPQSLEERREEVMNAKKSMFKETFGFDIDDMGEDDTETYFKRIQEEQEEKHRAYESTRKKSAKQIAKEKEIALEEKMTAKDTRSIYTALVKELHPDLEQDEALRNEKTEAMKIITQAYENNDVVELLKMQFKYLQNTDEMLANLVDEQVKRLNKVLKEQIDQLEAEIIAMTWYGAEGMMYRKFCHAYPSMMDFKFEQELKRINAQKEDMEGFMNEVVDLPTLKNFLKAIRETRKEVEKTRRKLVIPDGMDIEEVLKSMFR